MLLTDSLTRLHNRKGFAWAGKHLLASLNGRAASAMLLSVDVTHFKFVEHALGQAAANEMLKRTADILHDVFREDAVIGRWNANRLVVLSVTSPGDCNSSIATLNDRIDAANTSESEFALVLHGRFRLFDLPRLAGRRLDRTNTLVH